MIITTINMSSEVSVPEPLLSRFCCLCPKVNVEEEKSRQSKKLCLSLRISTQTALVGVVREGLALVFMAE